MGIRNYKRKETNIKGRRTVSPRAVIPPPARKGTSSAIKRKAHSHRPARRRPAAKTIWGRRTASPQGVIPPPARKGSDAIPPRLDPRWNSLRAQNKKKEERALEIKTEKETDVKGRRTTSPPGCDPAAGPAAGPR